jgi:hypothetical protein
MNSAWRARSSSVLLVLSLVLVAIAIILILIGIARPLMKPSLISKGFALLVTAFLSILWRIYLRREPILVLFRRPITFETHPVSYRLPFLFLTVVGCLLLYIVTRGA